LFQQLKENIHKNMKMSRAVADLEIHCAPGHLQRLYLHCIPWSCYSASTSLSTAAASRAMALVARGLDPPLVTRPPTIMWDKGIRWPYGMKQNQTKSPTISVTITAGRDKAQRNNASFTNLVFLLSMLLSCPGA
jgi:hypothetical protein